MALLKPKDREVLTRDFADLSQPVKLVVFGKAQGCEYCEPTAQIARELSELSDKISVETHDVDADQALADAYGVDKVPALIIMRGGEIPKDYGIRYYGIPAGYEFMSVVQDIFLISRGDSGLSAQARDWAHQLTKPIHLQVFVTPTCPYCPSAVVLAHQFAMESDLIRADMIEASEFPELSMKYDVMGVPRTVITVVNEDTHLEGAAPELMLLQRLQAAAG